MKEKVFVIHERNGETDHTYKFFAFLSLVFFGFGFLVN